MTTNHLRKCSLIMAAIAAPMVALAGPNAGGALLLHVNPMLLYTADTASYCGQSAFSSCDEANTTTAVSPSGTPSVIFAIAAFAEGAAPRLLGVTFGLEYDDALLTLVDIGSCADLELSTPDWPNPGSGTALTWASPKTSLHQEVYWFAAYAYESATTLSVGAHPTADGTFVDDGVPGAIDEIASYGAIGFGMNGAFACPDPIFYNHTHDYDVAFPAYDIAGYTSEATQEAIEDAESVLQVRYGSAWQVFYWNAVTWTPGVIYGGPVSVADTLTTDEEAIDAAEEVVSDNSDILGANVDSMRALPPRRGLGKVVVEFQQEYSGLDVLGATVKVLMTESGELLALTSSYRDSLTLDATPVLTAEEAVDAALERMPFFTAHTDSLLAQPVLAVLPTLDSESSETVALTWLIDVYTRDPHGAWRVAIDAHSGVTLGRSNQMEAADYLGSAELTVERPTPCWATATEHAAGATVKVDPAGSSQVERNGEWRIS